MKRILVDMSATLLHHGHIRLLKKAKSYGQVIVGLTTDSEILKCKGYEPEICYSNRKEILESIKYVDHVIPSPWLLTDEFLIENQIDYLVHGSDNSNIIPTNKLLIFDRTEGISSTLLRSRVLKSVASILNSSSQ